MSYPEPNLSHLYQEVILDHNRSPRNFKKLEPCTHHTHAVNPLCGDDYHLYLLVDEAGLVKDVGFQGSGCAISKASSSIMTTLVKGKSVAEAKALMQSFLDWMVKESVPEGTKARLGKLAMFEGVKEFPVRVKCATLIWRGLEAALERGAGSSDSQLAVSS